MCERDGMVGGLRGLDGPRPVRREEVVACHRLAAMCLPGFTGRVEEVELVASSSPPRRGGVQVICHGGVPVCQIGVYHSQVSAYGSPLRIASIGDVCTHPDYRELGLATRLLDYCMHKLRDEGARLMVVSGMRGLYTRSGCVTAQDFEYIALRPAQVCLRRDGFSLRPATEADASICARLHLTEAVHFVRQMEEFMAHFCQPEGYPQAEDWIIEVGERPVAYMLLSDPEEHWPRRDAGVREVFEYAGSRVALVGGLAQVMEQLGLRELRLFVPWQDVDFRHLLQGQDVAGERIPLFGHTMRIVNFPGLMADLRLYVEARLPADLRRALRFEQEGDRYAIAHGRERLELDGAAMTRLVMGIPEEMAPSGIGRSGALGKILAALFPLPSFLPGLNFR